MVPHVLGVGYAYNEYEVTAGRWKKFEIEFDYADNIKDKNVRYQLLLCHLHIRRNSGMHVSILVLLNIYIPIIILW